MPAISLMIEGQDGLTWPRWQRLAAEVEQLGFTGLYRSDHFTNTEPPDKESLEMIASLAYLAATTKRITFGPLVAPFSFREPTLLARQAAAIDDLSGGRLTLGLGAGWQQREHELFGFELGDVEIRMARFEEGLQVVTQLLRSDEPVSFEGRFYQLRGATLLPRPQRAGGPRIAIGGNGPRRTLPLAARYADEWNGVYLTPEAFRERSERLDALLLEIGRQPGDVRRTLMVRADFGRDEAALERKLASLRDEPEYAGKSIAEIHAQLRADNNGIVGTPDTIGEQISAYDAAGVDELMLQWLDQDDIDGLRALAEVARTL